MSEPPCWWHVRPLPFDSKSTASLLGLLFNWEHRDSTSRLNTFYPETKPSSSHVSVHLILTILCRIYYPQFTAVQSEARRGNNVTLESDWVRIQTRFIWLRSPRFWRGGVGGSPRVQSPGKYKRRHTKMEKSTNGDSQARAALPPFTPRGFGTESEPKLRKLR